MWQVNGLYFFKITTTFLCCFDPLWLFLPQLMLHMQLNSNYGYHGNALFNFLHFFAAGPIKSCSLTVFLRFQRCRCCCFIWLCRCACVASENFFEFAVSRDRTRFFFFYSNNIAFNSLYIHMRSHCLAFTVHIAHGYNVIVMKMKKKILLFFSFYFHLFSSR